MAPKASQSLERLVPRLRGKRIGVLGDLMLDRYVWGNATRLSLETPVPIVDFVEETESLGGAGNVAANLASLGARVEAFGAIGNDEAGRALRARLREKGIADSGVLVGPKRLTTIKTRIIARHHHIVRVDRERSEPLRAENEAKLLRALSVSLGKLDALILSDYNKGLITESLADRVLTLAHKAKVPVFVSPKTSKLYAHRGARAVVCNLKEAASFVTHALGDENSITEAGRALLAHFGCAAVVITRGAQGMSVFEESSPKHLHIAAIGVEVTYARMGQPGI